MKNSLDYTVLSEGTVVDSLGVVEKCAKCGRNGIVLDLGTVKYFTHYGMKSFLTARGNKRARRIRRNNMCRVAVAKSSTKTRKKLRTQ